MGDPSPRDDIHYVLPIRDLEQEIGEIIARHVHVHRFAARKVFVPLDLMAWHGLPSIYKVRLSQSSIFRLSGSTFETTTDIGEVIASGTRSLS